MLVGSLDRLLLGRPQTLLAASRLRVATDLAAGLEYLHAPGAGLTPILHRDVKSSNVLLDAGLRARIADVGLARPHCGATMTAGVGTMGYIDPEYIETGEISKKYFDIVVLGLAICEYKLDTELF